MHSRPSDSQDFGAAKRAKLDVVRVDGVSSKVTASADDDGRDDAAFNPIVIYYLSSYIYTSTY